LHGFQLGSW